MQTAHRLLIVVNLQAMRIDLGSPAPALEQLEQFAAAVQLEQGQQQESLQQHQQESPQPQPQAETEKYSIRTAATGEQQVTYKPTGTQMDARSPLTEEAAEIAAEYGAELRPATIDQSRTYTGPIVKITDTHAIQVTGRSAIAHPLEKLPAGLQVDSKPVQRWRKCSSNNRSSEGLSDDRTCNQGDLMSAPAVTAAYDHTPALEYEVAIEVIGFDIADLSRRIHEEQQKPEPDGRVIETLQAKRSELRNAQEDLEIGDERVQYWLTKNTAK